MSDYFEEPRPVSDRLVAASIDYLTNCGIREDPDLASYQEVMQHMLEMSIAESLEEWPEATLEMGNRAASYCDEHFSPDRLYLLSDRKFVRAMLNYALWGEEVQESEKGGIASLLTAIRH